ncbi:MAG: Gfo/Idh/MocA family oxidoreductase [Nocardioides sp.]|uniref:Gfo/Idh/MocA family protein n=1 Tax=Nocardioides sp. TaxID=35761 RepID=UPI0039E724DF
MASASTTSEIGWGILATGKIAHTFAADLAITPGARLAAVGSRSRASAQAFADGYAGPRPPRAHGSYLALVDDPEVEVVYLASPHSHHLEHARLALEAGKHVLCEKPLTLSGADSRTMIELARARDRFLMEAMWTATHPVIRRLRADLEAGRFGRVRHLHAELGFVVPEDPTDRMFDPRLGASAVLDMGIYPLALAHLLLGAPERLLAQADLRRTAEGILDLDIAMMGRYPRGALATMTASLTSWSSRRAELATDRGRIELDDFHHPTTAGFVEFGAESTNDGSSTATVLDLHAEAIAEDPVIGRGYGNEIAEVNRCLRAGLRESPLVPWGLTIELARQLDEVREQVGARVRH